MLWQTARGAHLALYPNLNAADPVWRALFRDVRFRRALSLGINRDDINQTFYFGLGDRRQQQRAAGKPAVPAGVPLSRGPSTTRTRPTACSTRSA